MLLSVRSYHFVRRARSLTGSAQAVATSFRAPARIVPDPLARTHQQSPRRWWDQALKAAAQLAPDELVMEIPGGFSRKSFHTRTIFEFHQCPESVLFCGTLTDLVVGRHLESVLSGL